MRVTITRLTRQGWEEVGTLSLCEGKVVGEPASPTHAPMFHGLATQPRRLWINKKPEWVDPRMQPHRYLSYLWRRILEENWRRIEEN